MHDRIQAQCQLHEMEIERLYQRLTQADNQQEKNAILKEIERITGVKIFY